MTLQSSCTQIFDGQVDARKSTLRRKLKSQSPKTAGPAFVSEGVTTCVMQSSASPTLTAGSAAPAPLPARRPPLTQGPIAELCLRDAVVPLFGGGRPTSTRTPQAIERPPRWAFRARRARQRRRLRAASALQACKRPPRAWAARTALHVYRGGALSTSAAMQDIWAGHKQHGCSGERSRDRQRERPGTIPSRPAALVRVHAIARNDDRPEFSQRQSFTRNWALGARASSMFAAPNLIARPMWGRSGPPAAIGAGKTEDRPNPE